MNLKKALFYKTFLCDISLASDLCEGRDLGLDDLEKLSKDDKVVEKYMSEIEREKKDPEFREFISAEEDNLKIENSLKRQYREEARAEGLAERHKSVAKKMLEKKYSIEDIMDITGLSKEGIKSLTE